MRAGNHFFRLQRRIRHVVIRNEFGAFDRRDERRVVVVRQNDAKRIPDAVNIRPRHVTRPQKPACMIVHVAAQRMAWIIVLIVLGSVQRRLPHAARVPQAGPEPGARQVLEKSNTACAEAGAANIPGNRLQTIAAATKRRSTVCNAFIAGDNLVCRFQTGMRASAWRARRYRPAVRHGLKLQADREIDHAARIADGVVEEPEIVLARLRDFGQVLRSLPSAPDCRHSAGSCPCS